MLNKVFCFYYLMLFVHIYRRARHQQRQIQVFGGRNGFHIRRTCWILNQLQSVNQFSCQSSLCCRSSNVNITKIKEADKFLPKTFLCQFKECTFFYLVICTIALLACQLSQQINLIFIINNKLMCLNIVINFFRVYTICCIRYLFKINKLLLFISYPVIYIYQHQLLRLPYVIFRLANKFCCILTGFLFGSIIPAVLT